MPSAFRIIYFVALLVVYKSFYSFIYILHIESFKPEYIYNILYTYITHEFK